ncbi:ParA family protein [Schaalia turicensis]
MIIAICNQKGGVGKTTLATNIAYQLGLRSEKPVLLVDADPQGNATTMMSIDVDSSTLTLNDVMSAIATGGSPEVTSHAVYPASEVWGNIEVLPADRLLASRENDVSLGREQRLASALSVIKHEYAHIVVDCPPSLGMLTTNALVETASLPLGQRWSPPYKGWRPRLIGRSNTIRARSAPRHARSTATHPRQRPGEPGSPGKQGGS